MEFKNIHHTKNNLCRKTNAGQKALSYVGPSLWNNLSKALTTSPSLNVFKHNIKHYFNELKKKES